jgi:hypothetical protein
MSLIKELQNKSIIILAKNFNPSVFNQYWIISNNFIDSNDILPNSVFSPLYTHISTSAFNLIVLPEQLQFHIINPSLEFNGLIEKTLLPMINKLQEVPYNAVGINFIWFIYDSEKTVNDLSREFFYKSDSILFEQFSTPDSRFGTYISKDFHSARLKLDIKPVTVPELVPESQNEFLSFAFNFHFALGVQDAGINLVKYLRNWQLCFEESQQIIDKL